MPCTLILTAPALPAAVDRLLARWGPYLVPGSVEVRVPPGATCPDVTHWLASDGDATDVLELPSVLELRAEVRP